VVDQEPRRGGLSANDEVTVVVAKAQYGLLPNFVGSSLADAQREATRLKVRLVAKTAPGREGTVLRQVPAPGVAVAPGMRVRLVVGDGSRT
jgi:beta-lactam-binding protein with PASTA domain